MIFARGILLNVDKNYKAFKLKIHKYFFKAHTNKGHSVIT